MKYKEKTFIVGNEEYVLLRIYDGELPVDDYWKELLELEKAQHKSTVFWYEEKLKELRHETSQ